MKSVLLASDFNITLNNLNEHQHVCSFLQSFIELVYCCNTFLYYANYISVVDSHRHIIHNTHNTEFHTAQNHTYFQDFLLENILGPLCESLYFMQAAN